MMGTKKQSVALELDIGATERCNQGRPIFNDNRSSILVLVYDRRKDGMRESDAKHFYREALRSNTDFACVYVDAKTIQVFAEAQLKVEEIELRDRSFRLSVKEQTQVAAKKQAEITPKHSVRKGAHPSRGRGLMVTLRGGGRT